MNLAITYLPVALHFPGSPEDWSVLWRSVSGRLKPGEWRRLHDQMRFIRSRTATLYTLRDCLRCAEAEAYRDENRGLRRAISEREYCNRLRAVVAAVEPIMLAYPGITLEEAGAMTIQRAADLYCAQLEGSLK